MQKGPDLLLEATPGILHDRRNAKIVFVGDGYMKNVLEQRANQLGIRHAVRFLGNILNWDMAASQTEGIYRELVNN